MRKSNNMMEKRILLNYMCFSCCLIYAAATSLTNFEKSFSCKKQRSFYQAQRETIQHFKNEERQHEDPVLHQYTKLPYPPITIPRLIQERNTYASGQTELLDDRGDVLGRINNSIFKGKPDFM